MVEEGSLRDVRNVRNDSTTSEHAGDWEGAISPNGYPSLTAFQETEMVVAECE